MAEFNEEYRESIHHWFGLTYANYLVLERTLLQSMPEPWQKRFVECLSELRRAYAHIDFADEFLVQARDARGQFTADPVPKYNRGRTYIAPL